MAIQEQFLSADRFLDLIEQPEYQDRVLELVHGALLDFPLFSILHGVITARLALCVGTFVERNALGESSIRAGFVLERNLDRGDTVRILDFAFVGAAMACSTLYDSLYEGGPDLAIEVISPNNKAGDTHLKVMQLLNAGTRLIWLVYPETRSVVVQTAAGATTLSETDSLSGGDVLPGFEIRVSDIFPQLTSQKRQQLFLTTENPIRKSTQNDRATRRVAPTYQTFG